MVNRVGVFRQMHFVGEEFMERARAAMLTSKLGEIAVDVVDFRRAASCEVLVHRRIVLRVCHGGGAHDRVHFAFPCAKQRDARGLGRAVGLIDQPLGERGGTGMRREFPEADPVHGAQN